MLVVFCHVDIPGFSGGFIGVDVFFVLSGYLISGLLITGFRDSGAIDFGRFYARRLLRLAPALFSMLLLVSVAAYFLYSPHMLANQLATATMASLWLSNIYLVLGEVDYFSPDATENLFLHTWSLSVEEQFYLLWPAIIFVVLKGTASASRERGNQRLVIAFALIALLSFSGCLYLSYHNAIAAYYLPTSRAWQFAIGALAFLASSGAPGETRSIAPRLATSLAWPALFILFYCATVITEVSLYPGWWAIAPTLATAILLLAGTSTSRLSVNRVLSTRPLVMLGAVSYSWYLWHWPVVTAQKSLSLQFSALDGVLAAGLSLLLAVASYRLIEAPTRHNASLRARPRQVFIATLLGAIVLVATTLVLLRTAANGVNQFSEQQFQQAWQDRPAIYRMDCDGFIHTDELIKCDFGSPGSDYKVLLIGDSIAGQWASPFTRLAEQREWDFTVMTKSSCPFVDEPYVYAKIGRRFVLCETWRERLLADIAKTGPDLVIVSSSHSYPFSTQQWQAGTERLLRKISPYAGRVVVLRSTPILPASPPRCMANQARLAQFASAPGNCDAPLAGHQNDAVYQALVAASEDFANVDTADLNRLICPDDHCVPTRGEFIVFRDKQHLTDSFATSLSARLAHYLTLPQ